MTLDWIRQVVDDPRLMSHAPARPWWAAQREEHALFLHYRAAAPDTAERLRSLVPEPLDLATYDGDHWLTVVGLRVVDVHVRWAQWLPGVGFPEIDIAVPVQYEGRRGLYFIGIEGAGRWSPLARWLTGFPYRFAGVRMEVEGETARLTSGPRWVRGSAAVSLDVSYTLDGDPVGDDDTLTRSLAAQYSAFFVRGAGHHRQVLELDEVHAPWGLHHTKVDIRRNTALESLGLGALDEPELSHVVRGRTVITWAAERVRPGRPGLAPTDGDQDRDATPSSDSAERSRRMSSS